MGELTGDNFMLEDSCEREAGQTLARVSESARLGLQVMIGHEFSADDSPPREIRWQHPTLKEYLTTVATTPKQEQALTVGYFDPVSLDGSDAVVVRGAEEKSTMFPPGLSKEEKSRVNTPLIILHSHPVPAQMHLREPWFTSENDPLLRLWRFKGRVRPWGIVGVSYPTGISDLYWTDLYLMPKNLSEPERIVEEFKALRQGGLSFASLAEIIALALTMPGRLRSAAREKLVNFVVAELNDRASERAIEERPSFDVFSPESRIKRAQVDRFCQRLGIIQYRAATTKEEMQSGCETLTFKLLDQ
ncbi:MAG: hypothetical protein JW991_02310 [Candidatus Pacebacteria bacterium]|nr:hypothetical protein [Candidatus Paceibacterota bacterium]